MFGLAAVAICVQFFFPKLSFLKHSPGILLAFDRAGLLLLLMFCGQLIKQIVVPREPPAVLNDSSLQPSQCSVTNLRKNICRAVQGGVTPR